MPLLFYKPHCKQTCLQDSPNSRETDQPVYLFMKGDVNVSSVKRGEGEGDRNLMQTAMALIRLEEYAD